MIANKVPPTWKQQKWQSYYLKKHRNKKFWTSGRSKSVHEPCNCHLMGKPSNIQEQTCARSESNEDDWLEKKARCRAAEFKHLLVDSVFDIILELSEASFCCFASKSKSKYQVKNSEKKQNYHSSPDSFDSG